jgi:hypothetical protein
MDMKLTRESRMQELERELYWLQEKGLEHLEKALHRLATFSEQHTREVDAFRLYYFAAEGERPCTLREIALKVSRTSTAVGAWKKKVLRRLKHPIWKDETRWPVAVSKTKMSTMGRDRVHEIAVLLQIRCLQTGGTERYIAALQDVARDLDIKDDDMKQFYLAICDCVRQKR